ncbi:hypothetical protein I204_05194 [Kwoniella mangroviensis CBS 8886]|uniref:uncharacterized protein n=1 Tax=Kwoniella mangroviensis CBS 8507 TaxID=1296122 RepID=UPI00080D5256|nr:uncharacterized protein I203_00756 [Kwoniella mangroviensis CBS 8507]OCF70621.1 hypothetical protein I203_00756 [Kwoniella mangroviensis CBS 8507]OCF74812.1 hypothetical protein I204_05194 [Kwoniella mangroviensis CBS 8886]
MTSQITNITDPKLSPDSSPDPSPDPSPSPSPPFPYHCSPPSTPPSENDTMALPPPLIDLDTLVEKMEKVVVSKDKVIKVISISDGKKYEKDVERGE